MGNLLLEYLCVIGRPRQESVPLSLAVNRQVFYQNTSPENSHATGKVQGERGAFAFQRDIGYPDLDDGIHGGLGRVGCSDRHYAAEVFAPELSNHEIAHLVLDVGCCPVVSSICVARSTSSGELADSAP